MFNFTFSRFIIIFFLFYLICTTLFASSINDNVPIKNNDNNIKTHSYAHPNSRGYIKGYWGNIDSLVDWCEPNYVISNYIAEFFNTLSSVPMAIWSVIGIFYCWKYGVKEYRFILTFLVLGTVGLGSMAFHGTLRFHAQLLDELPMVLGSFTMFYCTLETRQGKYQNSNKILIIALIIMALFDTIIYVFLKWWFIFVISYSGVVAIMLTYGAVLLWTCKFSLSRKIFLASVMFYYGGVLLWITENTMCSVVQSYQFHAIWHLAAGYGTYLWIWVLIALRAETLGVNDIQLKYGIGAHYIKLKIDK